MNKVVVTTLVISVMIALGGTARTGEIILNDTVKARYRYVKMCDVATVVGVSNDDLTRINDLFCGPAPEPAETREITVDYLKMRLRQSGFDPADFTFSGHDVVKLKTIVVVDLPLSADLQDSAVPEQIETEDRPAPRPSSSLAEKIGATVRKHAAAKLGDGTADLAVEIRNISKALLGLGDAAEVISVKPAREIEGPGKITFSVLARNGERKVRSAVVAEIGRNAEIAVAAEDIPTDTVLTEEMIEVKRVFVSSDMSDYFASPRELVGLKTRQGVPADQAVRCKMVERPVLVKRNEPVRVIVRVAGATTTVETNARADQNGCRGEFIKVTNVDSKKTFLAEVIGPRRVQVVLGED